MGRPEESKIFPTHSVALTIPFKPLRAGIVFSKGFHDSRFQGFIGMFCRGEPEYIYLKIRRPPTYKFFPTPVGNPHHFC